MLRKIGEVASNDPRSSSYRAEVVFGDSVYEMAPLGTADMDRLIRLVVAVRKDFLAAVAGKVVEESALAEILVETGILKKVVVEIFGIDPEEYERTTLSSLVAMAGEVLYMNFFGLPENARNSLKRLLETLSSLG